MVMTMINLLFSCRTTVRVKLAALEAAKEELAWGHGVRVRPKVQNGYPQGRKDITCLLRLVIGGSIHNDDCLMSPLHVLPVEVGH